MFAGDHKSVWYRWAPEYEDRMDALQVWSALAIISRDKLKTKLNALFSMFDCDEDSKLSYLEVEMLVAKSCMGLCRMTGTEAPPLEDLRELARMPFGHIEWLERHGSVDISRAQFVRWVSLTPVLLDTVCRFGTTNAQASRQVRLARAAPPAAPLRWWPL
jgi:hypothetical protein